VSIFDILPFQYLGRPARERLEAQLTWVDYPAGKVIVTQGDLTDDRVFLLESGTVDVIDHRRGPDQRIGTIGPQHYFGERPALFGTPRAVEIRAQTDCRCAWMAGDTFVQLLRTERAVAHGMTFILRDKQGLFTAFSRFLAEVKHASARGHIIIERLLPLYRELHPALHRYATDPNRIDFAALGYAVRRLPSNVMRTFVWFITDDCPEHYEQASARLFTDVTPRARRRVTWEMIPGKSMVLLRDGISDLLDLVTCLCIYAIEARKIRRRLRDARVLCELVAEDARQHVAEQFTDAEMAGLTALWGDALPQRLIEIALHHEDITLHAYKRTNNYNSAHAETWTQQIARATQQLLGTAPAALPDDFPVHVVSSNTHSVTNCLSPWLADNADRILAWGETTHPEWVDADWPHPSDHLVALLRPYLAAHPGCEAERVDCDSSMCIELDETAFTGIAVQLIDLSRVPRATVERLGVTCGAADPRGLVINIDYAFGQQAEPIVANLINLFGRRIRSVNILGKAGGTRGERGDIMVATAFVTQLDDVLQVPPIDVDIERLQARIPGRTVRSGRILTVLGTVLQNDMMLHTYDKLWDCIGLEMEGSFYCRQILESIELGLLPDDVALRFLYYISDLPLSHGESLSAGMTPLEGIPPLYATTREVLSAIFTDQPTAC
jgi:CRP-like cAMP-binding protein